jgi:hypothetical protein
MTVSPMVTSAAAIRSVKTGSAAAWAAWDTFSQQGELALGDAEMQRHEDAPGGSPGKTARCAGIGKTVTPHTLRHAVTASLDAGVPLRDLHMPAGCAAWPAYLCAGGQIGE